MDNYNKCIKDDKPLELALNDCLSCSGCVTEDEKQSILFSHLNDVKSLEKNAVFIISPYSKLNAYNYFNTGISYSQFEDILFNFLENFEVIDTSFYLNTILENIRKEFNTRSPLIISDCPGTVKYIQRNGHHLIKYLSEVYSPQEICALINDSKTIVSVIPCLDKKMEKVKIDYYLTTKEFIEYLNYKGFTLSDTKCKFPATDKFRGNFMNSFSGGYTEYLMNILKNNFTKEENAKGFIVYKSEKYIFYKIYGLKNILNFINMTRKKIEFTFAEVFLCDNACVGGPARLNKEIIKEMSLINELNYKNNILSDNIDFNCKGKTFKEEKIKKISFNVEW
ncbi:hypothetical protein H311_01436 [Anncaliia algerae PRA109]|nr:hypothetical protein H311_01436 [Anncaliia algerae PRA109]